jgi:hypothetical protein
MAAFLSSLAQWSDAGNQGYFLVWEQSVYSFVGLEMARHFSDWNVLATEGKVKEIQVPSLVACATISGL